MTRANIYMGWTQPLLDAARNDALDLLSCLADCEEAAAKFSDADEARADVMAYLEDAKSGMHAHLDDIQDAEQYTPETKRERRAEQAAATPGVL